jgi:hypothetical protein
MRNHARRAAPVLAVVALLALLPMALGSARPADTAVRRTAADAKPSTATGGPNVTPQRTLGPVATPAPAPTLPRTPPPTQPPTPGPTRSARPAPSPSRTMAPRPTRTPSPTARPTLVPRSPPPTAPSTAAPPFVLVGAGDIASCASNGDEATAALLDTIGGTVFTTGDNVYDNGTAAEFTNCYGPSWGRASIKARTRPVPGNHDYNTANGAGYFGYFGAAAGNPAKGYYAYDAGAWRAYVLNSNCAGIGGCAAGSPQEQWLRADLAANPRRCVVAMWHHSRYSSGGEHGSSAATQALYQALYDFNAELVLTGHDHDYERFAPQTATGTLDKARGLVQIVVGTGGKSHYAWGAVQPNSVVRNNDTYGVLRLALSATSWTFTFIPVAGKTFTDSGSGVCH